MASAIADLRKYYEEYNAICARIHNEYWKHYALNKFVCGHYPIFTMEDAAHIACGSDRDRLDHLKPYYKKYKDFLDGKTNDVDDENNNLREKLDEIVVKLNNSSNIQMVEQLNEVNQQLLKTNEQLLSALQDVMSKAQNQEQEQDDPYTILGITLSSTKEEIRAAWKEKLSKNHPDSVASLDPEIIKIVENRAKKINEAYQKVMGKK